MFLQEATAYFKQKVFYLSSFKGAMPLRKSLQRITRMTRITKSLDACRFCEALYGFDVVGGCL
jgi:hypothetical protein